MRGGESRQNRRVLYCLGHRQGTLVRRKDTEGTEGALIRLRAERILRLLIAGYERPRWTPGLDPVSELVATILSQHTSDVNSDRAFANLRASFDDWDEVRGAPVARIAGAVRSAGLANVKASRIKETLEYVARHAPRNIAGAPLSLAFLADLNVAEAKAWLRAIPGVGPKTAACVLMFALNKPALPVDTHVYRVSRRLGLIDGRTSVEAAHERLEALVASEDIFAFHVLLVTHGRRVCRAQQPRCAVCNLTHECDYYQGQAKGHFT